MGLCCSKAVAKQAEVPKPAPKTKPVLDESLLDETVSQDSGSVAALPIDDQVLSQLGLRSVVNTALEERVVAALQRPVITGDGDRLAESAAALLLHDLEKVESRGVFGWMGRAQVVFGMVDLKGAGWVGEEDCAALARAFLQGEGEGIDGALKEYLEDLANEGMLEAAVAAEAVSMMAHATNGRLDLRGFSLWLATFMEGLDEEVEDERGGVGGEGGMDSVKEEEGEGEGEEGVGGEEEVVVVDKSEKVDEVEEVENSIPQKASRAKTQSATKGERPHSSSSSSSKTPALAAGAE